MDTQNPKNQSATPLAAGDTRQQIVDNLKKSNNVLVTVSANPSVDQLAAAIGLTLMLHKLNKHATAVFSGEVPSTIEFLKPEETLEKNTDSLRDFIIALDRSKADKLRYKVEDKVVKIFITPYRTSISDKDLEFSQGDFNVDVVVALGVRDQADIDQAITAHGRILHDATVATVSTANPSTLGSLNWQLSTASSLSEMVAGINTELGKDILDEQIATALLTGIVAETERFSNDKTTPQTMSISAQLMTAGANQQLVATELEPAPPPPIPVVPEPAAASPPATQADPPHETPQQPKEEEAKPDDGTLAVPHDDENPIPEEEKDILANKQINIDDLGVLYKLDEQKAQQNKPQEPPAADPTSGSRMIVQPPTFGGALTAETTPEPDDPSTDPLSLPNVPTNILEHGSGNSEVQSSSSDSANSQADQPEQSLSALEDRVHADYEPAPDGLEQAAPDLDNLRSEVSQAAASGPSTTPLPPISALNAQTAVEGLNTSQPENPTSDSLPTLDMPTPPAMGSFSDSNVDDNGQNNGESGTAPPLPPPLPMPPPSSYNL